MAADEQLAFQDALGGMNASDPPHKLPTNQLARMINCAVIDGYPTTRAGVRVVPLEGDVAEFIAKNNCQGVKFFNPAKGQGGIILAESNSMLAIASGGRKFVIRPSGRREQTKATVENITNALFTNSHLHLVWWGAWEDLLIAHDGRSNAFIWDGANPSEFSAGYNSVNKPLSRIPNGATVTAYVHGRGVCIVNSRFILVSDSLHRTDQSSSRNLKEFVEQVYWATGQYFLPPSEMGGISAAAILPLQNTEHGHEDLMLHCEDGVFSLGLNVYPRNKWSETQMTKHVKLSAGATGPYAVAVYSADQIFRTRNGIESLRSAVAVAGSEGAPVIDLGDSVSPWLKSDYPRWLRFCSLVNWYDHKRLYCTTGPIVQGRSRWHRGAVVRNFDPVKQSRGDAPIWEGLLTLPPQISGIVQFVSGRFDGDERMFAITRGNDERTRLVEFTSDLLEDILEDGTRRPIRAQAVTRMIDIGRWWEKREWIDATLYLRNIIGVVKWGVWFRTKENPAWRVYRAGEADNPDECELDATAPRSLPIPLGNLLKVCDPIANGNSNEARGIQFLVRWEGHCQLEGLKVGHGAKDIADGGLDTSKLNYRFVRVAACEYDDFEYSETDENLWLTPDNERC